MLRLETQRKEIYSYIRWYWNVGRIDASFYANMIYEYSLSVNGYDSIIRKKTFYDIQRPPVNSKNYQVYLFLP